MKKAIPYHILQLSGKIFSFYLVFTLFQFSFVQAQELVFIKNGSFEKHKNIIQIDFNNPNWFDCHIDEWSGMNSGPLLCDCNYVFTDLEKYQGAQIRNCLKSAFTDLDNCTYVQLGFVSHVTNDLSLKYTPGIDASYISQKLNTKLSHGQLYEISFSMYVPKKYNENSQYLAEHFGINLSYKKLPNINGKEMYKVNCISADTFEHDNWINISKIVRPLCDINYITLGVFADNRWPDYYSERDVKYFIDNVSIKEIKETNDSMNIINFKCYNEDVAFDIEKPEINIYFDTNKDIFNEIDTTRLKKIIQEAKKQKLCINISGHTDNTGYENVELSQRRANNVKNYILENYKIDPIHFEIEAKGDSVPVGDNFTFEGRKKNRRVNIKLTNIPIAPKVYVEILKKTKINDPTVFKSINKWFYLEEQKKHLLILLDHRLSKLHNKKQWHEVYDKVKNEYQNFKNPELAFVLDSLTGEDQRYRTLKYPLKSLTPNSYNKISKELSNYYENIADSIEIKHDENNLHTILPILSDIIWPKISEVGIRASKSAYYIIDHSVNLGLIQKYLPYMKQACIKGEAEWINYANLYDKSMNIQNLPQKYGTHYVIEGKKVEYYKYEDFDKMNRDREMIGLPRLPKEIGFSIK